MASNIAHKIEHAFPAPMYSECALCPICKKKPIATVVRATNIPQMGIRISCPEPHEGLLEKATAVSLSVLDDPIPEIEAAMPMLKLWWNDQVAMHHAAEAMKARGGAARGRPGLRPKR